MQIIIDMDGTICTEERTYSRSMAKPLDNAIESINELFNEGHTIIIYSARTWMEYEMTVDWLSKQGVQYHQLILGKPVGDVWIDDRAITCDGWVNVNQKLYEKRKKQ